MIRYERVEEIEVDSQASGFICEKQTCRKWQLDIGDEIWTHSEFKMPVGHTGFQQSGMNMKTEGEWSGMESIDLQMTCKHICPR